MKRFFVPFIVILGLCGGLFAQNIQTVGEPEDSLKQRHVQIDSTLKFRGKDLTSFLQLVDANGQLIDDGIKSATSWNSAYSHSTSSHPYGDVGTKTVDEASIANGKVLKYNSTSGKVEYADDAGTTYTASGLGIKLSGTQFYISLDGATLSQGVSGLKVADNTFAAYGHAHSGVYEPVITTLGILKGGTNNTSFTTNKFLFYSGGQIASSSYDASSFATAGHVHTGTYEPAITTLGLSKGGTNNTSYTSGKFLAYDGSKLASTSYDNNSFSASNHAHSGTYEPANSNIQSHISSTSNPHSVTSTQVLPSQTGNSGKFLTTNGTAASWADVPTGEGADGNNYTTSIAFSGTSTKTLTLKRSGLTDLTSTFTVGTDEVSEGATNKYYTDTRARAALSSSATGLTYTSSTGVFSLTSGYSIPSTSNQTNWGTAYADRLKWDGGATGLDAGTGRTSLGLKSAAILDVGATSGTVAAGDHAHSGVYEPVITTLSVAKGGTNATSFTASQLLRMNASGTAFESAGVTASSFAPAAAGVTNGDSHDHSGGDGAQIAYSSLSGLPTLGTIASQASNNVSITGGNISGAGLTLVQGASAAPTLEGVIQWDTDDDKLKIGSGSATKTFSDDAYNASMYAAGSHVHAGTYEPAFTTLGIAKGGTNNTSYTSSKFVAYDGSKLASTSYDNTSFAAASHDHSGQTIKPDTVHAKSLTVNGAYTLPNSAGVAGQFLAHDGTWGTPSGSSLDAQNLKLRTSVLTIDSGRDILSSYSTIRFGEPRSVHELAYMGGVQGSGAGVLLDKAHDVAFTSDNYLMASSRGTDNAVTAWALSPTRYSTLQSAIRGAGSPYYMDDGVVVRAHPTKPWVAYAAYADSAIVVIDVSESKTPRVLGFARGAGGTNGLYLNAPHSVAWYGDWLISANGGDASITIFDCTDPDSSSFMTQLGHIRGAHGTNGLYLYAVSDVVVKKIGSNVYAFTVSRQDGNRNTPSDVNTSGCLQVFDITDPDVITLVGGRYSDEAPYETTGSYELEGATGITIDSNDRVYISTRWQNRATQTYDSGLAVGSLTIFDVSDPTDPTFLGCIKGRGTGSTSGSYPNGVYLGEAHWVSKYGNICAVSAFSDDCVTLIDVSNPASPTQVSHVGTAGDYCNGPVGNCFSPDGKLLYAASYWSAAFVVYDVQTPATPVRVGGKTGSGYPYYLDGAHGVAVSAAGDYVYVSSRKSDDALTIWSSEDGVRIADTYTGSFTNAGMMDPVRITVSGDYCYVAARTSDRVLKLNISNKTSITNVGSISGAGSPYYLDSPNSVVKHGNYLYVAAGGDNALVILNDVAGNNSPTLAGVYRDATYASAINGVAINADATRAYVAALGTSRITVLDITNKEAPTYINSVAGAGEPYYLNIIRDVVLVGNYLYGVSSNDDAVVVYDISGVDAVTPPRLVATYAGESAPNYADRAYGLVASGDSTLYVASFNDNALLELSIDGEDIIRENVISGASSLLTGAANVDVGAAYGKSYIAVASYTDNAFAVFKASEIFTLNEVGIRSNFGRMEYKNASDADWIEFAAGSGIAGISTTAPLTGGGTSGTVTVGADTTDDVKALATKGWVQRQGYGTSGGDITSVVAGDGLKGGGIANDITLDVNLSANGGLQASSDSLGIKLDGTTLTKSSLGLKVAPNTFAAYSHNHSGTYEPAFATLGVSKGGTNNASYTTGKFLAYDGAKLASTSYDNSSFSLAGHNHNDAYAAIGAGVTNGDSHDHSGGDGAQIAYSSLSGLPSLGSIASQAYSNVSITGGAISGTGITLVQGVSAAPTVEGVAQWDTDDDKLKIGSGTTTKTFSDDGYNSNTFAAAGHVHSGTYEPAFTTLGLAKGGTNATTYTAGQFLRVNSGGTAFESSGHTSASFAAATHNHTASDITSGILGSAYGGTGNGFIKFTGATTSEKIYTLPNSSVTLAYTGMNLSSFASTSSDQLAGVLSDETGSAGGFVRATNPTISGATLSVSNKTNIPGENKHLRFVLISPNAAVTGIGSPYNICIWPETDAAITITGMKITCNADPTTELDGDLKRADAFIGLTNAATLGAFDTTSGKYSSTSLSYSVASGKCLYLSFNAVPETALKSIAFDIIYDYD